MITIHDAPQGTPEWLSARAGCVTGSRASDVLAKIKTGEAAARRDYRTQLVAERLTGRPEESGFVNDAMRWGTEQEPFARMAYEAETGNLVRETGFIRMTGKPVGCSLDGDVDDFTGIVEIKCPKTSTHISWMLAGKLPAQHVAQVTHNMMVTGAKWCDFVSYDPRLPDNLRLFIVRVNREDVDIEGYTKELDQFLADVAGTESQLRARQ